MKRFGIILLLFLLNGCLSVSLMAQISSVRFSLDTLEKCNIYFKSDSDAIDSTYAGNALSLRQLTEQLNGIATEALDSTVSILVEGAASPVGKEDYNMKLSLRRAMNVEAFIRAVPGMENVDVKLVPKGEDWETFKEDIERDYNFPNRERLLYILNSNTSSSVKKSMLMMIDMDGATWEELVRNYMHNSRHVISIIIVKRRQYVELLPSLDLLPLRRQSSISHPAPARTRIPVASVRTNLLVPALNVGVEVPVGNRWSVSADYYYPWIWPHEKNRNCFEFLGWSAEGRYWFGRDRNPYERLTGHSMGVYAAAGYFDFEKNYRGMQGEFISPGIDYTYSMAVGRQKRVRLQFTIAVGYIRSWGRTYNVYGDYGELYPDAGTVVWDYVGPTKAAVTLSVPLYGKGGRR